MEIYKNVTDNKYEIVVRNDNQEEFKIHYGGADLYWSMSDYHSNNRFIITKETELFYFQLEEIFEIIEQKSNKFDCD